MMQIEFNVVVETAFSHQVLYNINEYVFSHSIFFLFFLGGLLNNIIKDLNSVINGTLVDRKINLFSAHDVNMVSMLKALKIFDHSIPQFTSSVILELRERDGDYFVQVFSFSSVYLIRII